MNAGRDRWLTQLEERVRRQEIEVLITHGGDGKRRDFTAYLGRPAAFFREQLGFTAYPKQLEVVEAFEEARRVVVRGCHGAGKDAVLAALALYAAYVRGMLVLIISATERQVLGQVWREVRQRFAAGQLPGQLYTQLLKIGGEPRILCMTSSSTSHLTGWHDAGGVLTCISEGQSEAVEDAAYDAALANATDARSRVLVVGNPIRPVGRFYEASRKPTWRALRISAFDHPNVIQQQEVIPGGPAPSWPEEMAAEFGADSPWYVSRVLGEFPEAGTISALFNAGWIEDAAARHPGAGTAWLREPVPVVAVDVARSVARDESVLALVQGAMVRELWAWRLRDLMATTDRVLEVTDAQRLAWFAAGRKVEQSAVVRDQARLADWLRSMGVSEFPIHVDTPGIGGGVVDRLQERGRLVTEYWGWVPAGDPKRFANRRAEVYWHARTLLESGKVAWPADPKLLEEAAAAEWSQDTKGRIALLPKEEVRKALGRSPDRLDACVIGLAAAASVGASTVAFGSYDL